MKLKGKSHLEIIRKSKFEAIRNIAISKLKEILHIETQKKITIRSYKENLNSKVKGQVQLKTKEHLGTSGNLGNLESGGIWGNRRGGSGGTVGVCGSIAPPLTLSKNPLKLRLVRETYICNFLFLL